jgi:hypothetical protein
MRESSPEERYLRVIRSHDQDVRKTQGLIVALLVRPGTTEQSLDDATDGGPPGLI